MGSKGSIGHAFAVRIRTGNRNQVSFCPIAPREISVLSELTLGHLCYRLTDVPPQPNSPPDYVPCVGWGWEVGGGWGGKGKDRSSSLLSHTPSSLLWPLNTRTQRGGGRGVQTPPPPRARLSLLNRVSKPTSGVVVFHCRILLLPLMLHLPSQFTKSD